VPTQLRRSPGYPTLAGSSRARGSRDDSPPAHRFDGEQFRRRADICQEVLRHENVLEHIRPTGGARMTRCAHHEIASFVPSSATLPVSVRLSQVVPAFASSLGLQLLDPAAFAKFSRSTRGTPKMSTRWMKHAQALLAPSMPHEASVTSGRELCLDFISATPASSRQIDRRYLNS
jgi:hypothetical protein